MSAGAALEIGDSEDDAGISDEEPAEDSHRPVVLPPPLLHQQDATSLGTSALALAGNLEKQHVPASAGDTSIAQLRQTEAPLADPGSTVTPSYKLHAMPQEFGSPESAVRMSSSKPKPKPKPATKDIYDFDDTDGEEDEDGVQLVKPPKRKRRSTLPKKSGKGDCSGSGCDKDAGKTWQTPSTTKRRAKSTPVPELYADDEFSPELYDSWRNKKSTRRATVDERQLTPAKKTRVSRAASKGKNYYIEPFPPLGDGDNSSPAKATPSPVSTRSSGKPSSNANCSIRRPLESGESSPVRQASPELPSGGPSPAPAVPPTANFVIDLSHDDLILPAQLKKEYDAISADVTTTSMDSSPATKSAGRDNTPPPRGSPMRDLSSTIPDPSSLEMPQPSSATVAMIKSIKVETIDLTLDTETDLDPASPQKKNAPKKRAKTDVGLGTGTDHGFGSVASEWRAAKGKSTYGDRRTRTFSAGDVAAGSGEEKAEETSLIRMKGRKPKEKKTPARKKSRKTDDTVLDEPTECITLAKATPPSLHTHEASNGEDNLPVHARQDHSLSKGAPAIADDAEADELEVSIKRPVARERKRSRAVVKDDDDEDEFEPSAAAAAKATSTAVQTQSLQNPERKARAAETESELEDELNNVPKRPAKRKKSSAAKVDAAQLQQHAVQDPGVNAETINTISSEVIVKSDDATKTGARKRRKSKRVVDDDDDDEGAEKRHADPQKEDLPPRPTLAESESVSTVKKKKPAAKAGRKDTTKKDEEREGEERGEPRSDAASERADPGVEPALSTTTTTTVLQDKVSNTVDTPEKEKEGDRAQDRAKGSSTTANFETPPPPAAADRTTRKSTPHSPIRRNRGRPFRVGLSRNANIESLLKIRRT